MPSRLNNFNKLIWLVPLMFFSAGCTTIYNPATQKNETIFIDTEGEVALGRSMAGEVKQEFKIIDDSQDNYRLDSIGQKVAANSDRRDLDYHFSIIKDDELNAFALPGGFIYVNSAITKTATNDELACVLAHEIGHVAARHSVKRIQAVLGYQIIMSIAMGLSGATNVSRAVDVVFNVTTLGYSRADENLADRLAVKYAKHAGFNPNGMLSFFEKLKKEAEKRGPRFNLVFLSSHPPIEERIKNIKNEIVKLEQYSP